MPKIIPFDKLAQWRDGIRAEGRRLVVTNGVFDLMHRGHAEYLSQAAALGDILLVLVTVMAVGFVAACIPKKV